MRVVVITPEAFVPGEAAAIERLLRSGAVWRVHLRKPGCPPEAMRSLIEAIPHDLHTCTMPMLWRVSMAAACI